MTYAETKDLDDLAGVLISGRDLKLLLDKAQTLGSGLSPKGEMCFLWGKQLLAVVESAEEFKS